MQPIQIYSTESLWRWPISLIGASILLWLLAVISSYFYPWNPKPHPPAIVTTNYIILQQPPVIEIEKQDPVEVVSEPVDTKIFESIWNGAVDIADDFLLDPEKPSLVISNENMFKKAARDTSENALLNNYMDLRQMQWDQEKPGAKIQIENKKWEGIRERKKSSFNEFWLK
jgi:hypothetical protein